MKSMLVKAGWKKDLIEKSKPVDLWLDGRQPPNKSEHMASWKGADLEVGSEKIHVDSVYDLLNKRCRAPGVR